MDYELCGGAMLLGLSKTVVKGHGNSRAKGFSICIEQAANAVRGDMVTKIKTLVDNTNAAIEAAEQAKQAEQSQSTEENTAGTQA